MRIDGDIHLPLMQVHGFHGINRLRIVACAAASMLIAWASSAVAVPPGDSIEYPNNPMGVVVFDGKTHLEQGHTCDTCHAELFSFEKHATKISYPDHLEGKVCFSCHAVSFKEQGNCMDCHTM